MLVVRSSTIGRAVASVAVIQHHAVLVNVLAFLHAVHVKRWSTFLLIPRRPCHLPPRTPSLRDPSSWRYDGLLCCGDGDTGAVWECPLVAQLRPLPPSHSRLPSHTLGLGQRRHSMQRLSPVSEDSVIGSSGKGDGMGGRKSGDWSGPATPTYAAANGLPADYDER